MAYTRAKVPPWPLRGGQPGSTNHVIIRRADGSRERHTIVNRLPLYKGDVIQIMTATGAGWGNPRKRDRALILSDLKNDFISLEEAETIYGVPVDDF